MTDAEALLRRVDAYLDAAPRSAARPVDAGPLRAFVSTAPWPYYVRPRPDLDLRAPGAVTAADVRAAAQVLREAGQAVAFEWVEELAPGLGALLLAEGHEVRRFPLLVQPLPAAGRVAAGPAARLLDPDDPQLPAALAVQALGFGAPGTATGPAGAAERDAHVPEPELLEHVRSTLAAGRSVAAVAELPGDGVVATGWHTPVGATTEVVGVATLPAFRRRGAAAAVLEVLVADAERRGCTLALLSAGDDDVARLYESAGFRRIGHVGAAEPRGPEPDRA